MTKYPQFNIDNIYFISNAQKAEIKKHSEICLNDKQKSALEILKKSLDSIKADSKEATKSRKLTHALKHAKDSLNNLKTKGKK